MKKFLKHIFIALSASLIFFEVLLRVFHLTNDVPRRKIENNLQSYKINQEGYYKGAKWKVNNFGFLGFDDTFGGNDQVLLVGDSYVENMMNDIECHIGFYLKENNLKVFELARSGMTFIEYLEFIKFYTPKIKQAKTIVLVNENDIKESISNINEYSDRLQINVESGEIKKVKIKSPFLKSVLYNIKSLYYLYSKGFLNFSFPQMLSQKDKVPTKKDEFSKKFFKLIKSKYDLSDMYFICFNMGKDNLELFKNYNLNFIGVNDFKRGELRDDDNHFTCSGNKKIADLILKFFI